MIEKVQEIYDILHEDKIVMCGSLADYLWIKLEEEKIADLDFIIQKEHFFEVFQIKKFERHITKLGFCLEFKPSNLYGLRYQGKFEENKIEFYIRTKLENEDFVTSSGDLFNVNKTIKIHSINKRIKIIKQHLNLEIFESDPDWRKKWVKIKKEKAREKLAKYYNLQKSFL